MIICHVHREPAEVEPVPIHGPAALSGCTIRLVLKKYMPQLLLALNSIDGMHIT